MNDINKITAKIKKLLALSKSPNPNEAASALRMAQGLMAEHDISRSDINTLDIGEEASPAPYRRKPPRYEAELFEKISDAFGCRLIHRYGNKCVWVFLGLRHRVQVAAYIGQILFRKLRAARASYIKSLYRVRSKSRKTQRADDYCLAWVSIVTEKLSKFAGVSDEEQQAIALYKNKAHPNLGNLGINDRSFGNAIDYLNGTRAGGDVQLQHGVGVHSSGSLFLGA